MNRIHLTMQLQMISEEVDILVPCYGIKEAGTGISKEDFYAQKFKCLWLLHGLGGVSADWFRFSMVEVFAEEKNIFVICPEARSSFYTDCPQGDNWETRITEEIWDYLHTIFPMMSDRPEDNLVAGYSMGGYGAMRYALAHPDKFGYGIALSGGLNVPQRYAEGESINGHLDQSFGARETVVGSRYDLYVLAEELMKKGQTLPSIYMACGTQDWEYRPNHAFYEYLKDLGINVSWDEGDYGHEWRFWNEQIEKALNKVIPENLVSSKSEREEVE